MSEESKAMVRRLMEAINAGDEVAVVDFRALEDSLSRMRQLGLLPSRSRQSEEASPT